MPMSFSVHFLTEQGKRSKVSRDSVVYDVTVSLTVTRAPWIGG